MRIGINLATRPFANLGPILKNLRIAMGALVLVAILLVVGLRALDQKAEKARARDHSLDGQIAQVSAEQQSYRKMMQQPENASVLNEAQTLNALFDEKAFSWTLAMEDLETVLPGGVQVTTLEPARDKDGHITLKMRVLGPRDRAIQLVENLEHSHRFLTPRITGESTETNSGPNERLEPVSASNRVTFELLTDYNPLAPGERRHAKAEHRGEQQDDVVTKPILRAVPPLPPGERRMPYTGAPNPPRRPGSGGMQ